MTRLVAAVVTWLREAFTDNVGLKALSLTFALGLFTYLHGQQDQQQRAVAVNVVLRLPPDSDPPPAPLRPRAAADPEAAKSSSTPLRTPALARRAEALTSAREPGAEEEPQRVSDPERDRDS